MQETTNGDAVRHALSRSNWDGDPARAGGPMQQPGTVHGVLAAVRHQFPEFLLIYGSQRVNALRHGDSVGDGSRRALAGRRAGKQTCARTGARRAATHGWPQWVLFSPNLAANRHG